MEALESRVVPYTTSGNAWPHPNLVTISFVPDGTNLGGVSSNLFATFNAKWATTTWENQILRAAQVWAQQTNLNFSVITDSGGAIGSGNYQQGDPSLGDIRIGGYNFGTSTLATAYLPPPVNNYSIAGDIQFNTGQTFNIGSTYDLFTVAAHEIGHALGLLHTSVSTAVMYASYNTRKTALASDDISGIQATYSGARTPDAYDASSANGSFATASNIQSQISTTSLTALVSNLDVTTTSDVDYYTFTAPSGTNSSFTVTVQSKGLSLLGPSATIYASDQTTVLGSATGADRTGNTLAFTITSASAGKQYYVKVASGDTTAFGTGAYALVLNFGAGAAPTVTPPNTQTLNGNPLSDGGGQPENSGHDAFPDDVAPRPVIDPASGIVAIRSALPQIGSSNTQKPGEFNEPISSRASPIAPPGAEVDQPDMSFMVRLSGSSTDVAIYVDDQLDLAAAPLFILTPDSKQDAATVPSPAACDACFAGALQFDPY